MRSEVTDSHVNAIKEQTPSILWPQTHPSIKKESQKRLGSTLMVAVFLSFHMEKKGESKSKPLLTFSAVWPAMTRLRPVCGSACHLTADSQRSAFVFTNFTPLTEGALTSALLHEGVWPWPDTAQYKSCIKDRVMGVEAKLKAQPQSLRRLFFKLQIYAWVCNGT